MLRFICRWLFLLGLILSAKPFSVSARQLIDQQIIKNYDTIRKNIPREKVYVQLDKQLFALQDTLWFKAYLVDATTNAYSPISGLIYFDLISSAGNPVATLALPCSFGLTWGSFVLAEKRFPPGRYTFRAYTRWMQNFGSAYIFKREITIVDPQIQNNDLGKSKISAASRKVNPSKLNLTNSDIDIQFLPEGGSWLQQITQKMAFKAINSLGKGIKVEGEILDSKQQKVADFKSNMNGMGYFKMMPLPDEQYSAKIKVGDKFFNQKLPKSLALGTALSLDVNSNADSMMLKVFSTQANPYLTIIGQSRGNLCFIAHIKADKEEKAIKVSKNLFPTGVSQILLVNELNQVLNERCFFLKFKDQLMISSAIDGASFGKRDSIPLKIKVTDGGGNPVEGSFSLSVTDDHQILKDITHDSNILSDLLLTSDLKGEIEKPGQYFASVNRNAAEDLDALMLTQGWVSYDWPMNKIPEFKPENDYTISGTVTNIFNKPAVGAKVTILGQNKGFMMMDTVTNKSGEFLFKDLPILDSASVVIQALNVNGKKGTLGIELNEFKRPLAEPVKGNTEQNEVDLPDSTIQKFLAVRRQTEEALIKSGIVLREVKIFGKSTVKGSKNLNGPGNYSQVLTDIDLEPMAKKTLYDVLMEKIKGFRPGFERRSGKRDFFINFDLARFVIDGMDIDRFYMGGGSGTNAYYEYVKSYLDYYSAEDIIGIETMENGLSWSYRSQFKHPMDNTNYAFIEITTKVGLGPFLKKAANMYLLRPINYGDKRVFYQPKYTNTNKDNARPDYRSTIYWNPNIITDKDGVAEVSFFSSDQKGSYTVWIEGTDINGGLGLKAMKINIR
ncbi:carboxypeptidase-like regulatory domain-containing protein [Pedobacter sp. KLB.chiD]|uniref:carboxypeptidase-like regulatory domain-containing protein n=1 Tax=Pedobacter sp. KLB.chiD TaxID=3387402 RepID=UPI00399BC389